MSLLTLVQKACTRIGITKPTAIVSSSDEQVIQLLGLANEEGDELAARYRWQNLTKEATFTTVATESQGSITTIAGTDFRYILNDTIWDRTLRRPIFGPLIASQWQQLKAQNMQGPWYQFRIRGNLLLFIPVPTAGDSCNFEWISRNWCQDSGATTTYAAWNADTDTGLIDEDVMAMGLIWRWKAAKGLDYGEDFNKYERRVADLMAQDAGKQKLNLEGFSFDLYPGIVVPSGSWQITS